MTLLSLKSPHPVISSLILPFLYHSLLPKFLFLLIAYLKIPLILSYTYFVKKVFIFHEKMFFFLVLVILKFIYEGFIYLFFLILPYIL